MAVVNPEFFVEGQPSELSLFELPPTQTAVDKVYYQQILPLNQITDTAPIQFSINAHNGMEYIDTRNSFMSIKARLVHADDSFIEDTEYVGPVNLLSHSLFGQIDVAVQGKFIAPAASYYPYKAVIQTLLKYGTDAKSSQLSSQLFYKDEHAADNDPKTGKNKGFLKRTKLFSGSKLVHMISPILHDAFQLEKFILNQVGIDVKFYRTKPEFYLMTDSLVPNYKIKIEEMILNICKVQVNPAVIYAHSLMLQKTSAKYPLIKTEVRMAAIAQGQSSFTADNVCQGSKPNRIVVSFVKGKAVAGDFSCSPFNFEGFNLSDVNISVDGMPAYGNPIKVNFNEKSGIDCAEAFHWMMRSSGKWLKDSGNQLEPSDLADGYCLFVFDLNPNFHNSPYLPLIKQGIVKITANFSTPLSEPVTCIIYSEEIGYFEINESRDVQVLH